MITALHIFLGGKNMVKCFFCGKNKNSFAGIHLFKNDGSIAYFCSSKCRKNTIKLRRDKRKIRWTAVFRSLKLEKNKIDEERKTL